VCLVLIIKISNFGVKTRDFARGGISTGNSVNQRGTPPSISIPTSSTLSLRQSNRDTPRKPEIQPIQSSIHNGIRRDQSMVLHGRRACEYAISRAWASHCRRAISQSKSCPVIIQAGILLQLPQLTLATASVFLHRFYMRYSIVPEREGYITMHVLLFTTKLLPERLYLLLRTNLKQFTQ